MDKFSEPTKASTPNKKETSIKNVANKKIRNIKGTYFHLGKPESQMIGYIFSGSTYEAKAYIEQTLDVPHWVSKSTCSTFHTRVRNN
jgi:hypothetical protein